MHLALEAGNIHDSTGSFQWFMMHSVWICPWCHGKLGPHKSSHPPFFFFYFLVFFVRSSLFTFSFILIKTGSTVSRSKNTFGQCKCTVTLVSPSSGHWGYKAEFSQQFLIVQHSKQSHCEREKQEKGSRYFPGDGVNKTRVTLYFAFLKKDMVFPCFVSN